MLEVKTFDWLKFCDKGPIVLEVKTFDWLKFCDPEIARCGSPWVKDGWKYATDSVICVRCKTDEPDAAIYKHYPDLSRLVFNKPFCQGDEVSVVALPELIPCEECQHKCPTEVQVECKSCRKGMLDCFECGHRYECPECDGTGLVMEAPKCDSCTARYTVRFRDDEKFARDYVMLLLMHGVTEILVSTEKGTYGLFVIEIDGQLGEGALMPVVNNK